MFFFRVFTLASTYVLSSMYIVQPLEVTQLLVASCLPIATASSYKTSNIWKPDTRIPSSCIPLLKFTIRGVRSSLFFLVFLPLLPLCPLCLVMQLPNIISHRNNLLCTTTGEIIVGLHSCCTYLYSAWCCNRTLLFLSGLFSFNFNGFVTGTSFCSSLHCA